MWVRRDGAFEAVIDSTDFVAAQTIIVERYRRTTDSELLDRLRALADQAGRLSGVLIDETDGMPSSAAYRHRFGRLARAFQLISYTPDRDLAFVEVNRRLRGLYLDIVDHVVAAFERGGGVVTRNVETDLLTVNGMLSVSVVIARCQTTSADARRWIVRIDGSLGADLTVAVRMDAPNRAALDYYVLPSLDVGDTRLRIKEDNGIFLDGYRFDSLDFVLEMVQPLLVEDAA